MGVVRACLVLANSSEFCLQHNTSVASLTTGVYIHLELLADGQEEVASADHKKRKRRGRTSSQVKVDKERLMTSTEAAATNEKLPKGFMYVPAHRLNSTPGANE